MKFTPQIEPVGRFTPIATIEEMAREPMVRSASLDFAIENGGPLTRRILHSHDFDLVERLAMAFGLHIVIDTRVQMLMPGMFPSIPGWHCDAIPRGDYNSQPDFSKLNPNAGHYIGSISTHPNGVSNTRLLIDEIEVDIKDDLPTWQQVHREVERVGADYYEMPDGIMTYFSPKTIHAASPTKNRGWRCWLRLSLYHHPPKNEITNRTQVYILSEENGW